MQTGQASLTARGAAGHRAAHQVLEGGRIFEDPLALAILGDEDAQAAIQRAREDDGQRRMRFFIAVRTRLAEEALAAAVARGATQLVVLGAGLDTYAYRGALREHLQILEVDHPDTQAWKQQKLQQAGIAPPPNLRFAPIDFERQTLADGLAAAGFDASRRSFFTWLGVVPYLSEASIDSTLAFIAGVAGGAHVVFDYSDPPSTLQGDMRSSHDAHAERVAALGEPWRSYFEADALRAKLLATGFRHVDDAGPQQIAARFVPERAALAPTRGGHVVHAHT